MENTVQIEGRSREVGLMFCQTLPHFRILAEAVKRPLNKTDKPSTALVYSQQLF